MTQRKIEDLILMTLVGIIMIINYSIYKVEEL